MPDPSIEHQGLLRPESFDLDDIENGDPPLHHHHHHQNGHARFPSKDFTAGRRTLTSASSWLRPRYVAIGLAVVAALLLLGVGLNRGKGFKIPRLRPPRPFQDTEYSHGAPAQWEKPSDFKIIGLIFFGRPSVVAILDCYLKKHLVTNGGWLDEVHFAVHTDIEEDLAYLDSLVKTTESYKKIEPGAGGYNTIWEHAVQREHMYIKIDDDIVRISL